MDNPLQHRGETYGRLTVLMNAGRDQSRCLLWRCRCSCGRETVARASDIRRGHTASCGCLALEICTIHGEWYTRLYDIWNDMRERCRVSGKAYYPRYGGRGIQVCEEWESYLIFREWALSHGYRDDLQIDRIDVNGNYEPGNCRWVTRIQQANNTTVNRHVVFRGQKMTVAQFARLAHCDYRKTYYWLIQRGMTPEEFVELGPHRKE